MPRTPKTDRARSTRIRRSRLKPLECTRLEEITLLSAYLYVDFGDNFAGGVLQGAGVTVGDLYSHTAAGGANIHGPRLSDNQNNDFAANTSLILNSFSTFYTGIGKTPAEVAQWRTTINAMVERVYAPYDVTVIDLTAAGTMVNGHLVTAAANFDDVSRTLAASGLHDSYVFVAQAIIGGTVADDTTDPTQFQQHGYGGIASDLDIGHDNDNIGTALSLLRADYGTNKNGQTIAHEAGHLFGLAHAWRSDHGDDPDPRDSLGPYKDQLDLYHGFDTMSYLAHSGVSAFSRVPTTADKVLDGGNWVPNLDPAILNTTPNPYEHFKGDPNVGIRNVEYVTGTGAHDIITIAKTGPTTAMVTVQPFFDATYATPINIPGQATATYSYVIDTSKPLILDGGSGNDRFILDGDLGTTVTVRGDTWKNDPGTKADTLVIRGKGAASAVYVPGTNREKGLAGGDDLRGQIVIGSTIVNFLEFSADGGVTVSDVQDFVFRTPPVPVSGSGGSDLTVDSPSAGRNRVSGTTSGVAVVPLTFYNVANFTIDTRTNNVGGLFGDSFTINNPGGPALVASGLANFTITSSAGDDVLTVNASDFRLPVAGGEFVFDGGTGHYSGGTPGSNLRGLISFDRIVVHADVDYQLNDVGAFASDRTPPEGLLAIAPAGSGQASLAPLGSIRLISIEAATLNAGDSGSRLDGSGFSGSLVLNGGIGNDVLIGGSGANEIDSGGGDDLMVVGRDAFAQAGLGSQNQIILRGGGANLLRGGSGRNTFLVDLNGTATLIGGSGDNQFNVVNPANGVLDPVGGLTVIGGGTSSVLRLIGGGGPAFNQAYLLGPAPGAGEIVTTNNYVIDGPTISQFIRFQGITAIDDSTAANQFLVVPESAAAPIGGVSGDGLAAGVIQPTVGGSPFGEIRFSNKSAPMVLLPGNQLVRPTSPLPVSVPAMTSFAALPLPASSEPIAAPAIASTTTSATPTPAPASAVPVTPSARRHPKGRPTGSRPTRRRPHQAPRKAPRGHAVKHSAAAPKGPLAHFRRP